MVEGFAPRPDVLRAYLRNSRTSELNALNMRARVAALRMTYQRIRELIDEYGLAAFLAAQEGIIAYVERVVRSRLREIPDGSWFGQIYHDHDGTHDEIYRMCCRVTKRADRLVVDLTGTSPQAPGPINCARPAMEGAIIGVILTFLCYDLPWAIGAPAQRRRDRLRAGHAQQRERPGGGQHGVGDGHPLDPGRGVARVREDAAGLGAPSR